MGENERQETAVEETTVQENKNQDRIVEMLESSIANKVDVDIPENNGKSDTQEIIKNVNNKFLIDVLSPEIKLNEDKKRTHKDWLMIAMGGFLFFQFVVVAVMVCYSGYWIIGSHVSKNPFSDDTIQIIFTFIGAYITSVIIELIAILNYIVKNVFDTSIAGLVQNFKEDGNKESK